MDRFRCAECREFFFFDLELDGMTAEPGEKLPLACPLCQHPWSFYKPEDLEIEETVH